MNNMNEIWKDIPGYENLYQVSNFGRVKSKRRILKPVLDRYLCVNLSKDGKQKKFSVHQLVILSFTNIKSNYKITIDHINSDKLDNRLENLRLVCHRINASKDRKSNTGYTGVYKTNKGFTSHIRIDGIKKHIGTFTSADEAHKAYKKELYKLNA